MTAEATYLQACAQCAFWENLRDGEGLCRRRAPQAAYRAEQVAHWPQTHGYEGCGEHTAPTVAKRVNCSECAFWRRFRGGMHPMNRSDMPNSWWAHAGRCARHAPRPVTEPGPRAFWRATAETDSCGEGLAGRAETSAAD